MFCRFYDSKKIITIKKCIFLLKSKSCRNFTVQPQKHAQCIASIRGIYFSKGKISYQTDCIYDSGW